MTPRNSDYSPGRNEMVISLSFLNARVLPDSRRLETEFRANPPPEGSFRTTAPAHRRPRQTAAIPGNRLDLPEEAEAKTTRPGRPMSGSTHPAGPSPARDI